MRVRVGATFEPADRHPLSGIDAPNVGLDVKKRCAVNDFESLDVENVPFHTQKTRNR